MLRATRYSHEAIVLNLATIAYIESTPDTYITLVNGERVHVRESVDEILERALAWQRSVAAAPVGTETRS